MTSHSTLTADPSTDREDGAYYVLGGRQLGAAVARRLGAEGQAVCVVDESYERSETPGFRGDPTDVRTLEAAGIGNASAVVVATDSDSRNLLIAQVVRTRFEVPKVVVLANDPDRLDTFTEAGHSSVCATAALSDALSEAL